MNIDIYITFIYTQIYTLAQPPTPVTPPPVPPPASPRTPPLPQDTTPEVANRFVAGATDVTDEGTRHASSAVTLSP